MSARRLLSALLLAAAIAALPAAASAAASPARPRASVVRRPAATAAPKRATTARAKADSSRTLEPIHIEGELDVPEVLFITARDQRRIVEFQHRRYRKSSAELLRDTPAPTRIVVDRRVPPVADGGAR